MYGHDKYIFFNLKPNPYSVKPRENPASNALCILTDNNLCQKRLPNLLYLI